MRNATLSSSRRNFGELAQPPRRLRLLRKLTCCCQRNSPRLTEGSALTCEFAGPSNDKFHAGCVEAERGRRRIELADSGHEATALGGVARQESSAALDTRARPPATPSATSGVAFTASNVRTGIGYAGGGRNKMTKRGNGEGSVRQRNDGRVAADFTRCETEDRADDPAALSASDNEVDGSQGLRFHDLRHGWTSTCMRTTTTCARRSERSTGR